MSVGSSLATRASAVRLAVRAGRREQSSGRSTR
jgi:hypothetical protein